MTGATMSWNKSRDDEEDDDRASTRTLSEDELRAASARDALPFGDAPDDDEMPGTLTLSEAERSALGHAPATPFQPVNEPAVPSTGPSSPAPTPGLNRAASGVELIEARVAAAKSLPLRTYAAIKAETWTDAAALPHVLSKHAVDETSWFRAEKAYTEALAMETAQGHSDLSIALTSVLRELGVSPRRAGKSAS